MQSAKIIAHSICPYGTELITFELSYWRAIHSEFMTHRVYSRNAASSRAIPIEKMLWSITEEPAMPIWWGKNQSGMQAREEVDEETKKKAVDWWLRGRDLMVAHAKEGMALGLHKQIVNRVTEPWMHITVVATTSYTKNFYKLRDHEDAQPEFHDLASKMRATHQASKPVFLEPGKWHKPYIDDEDYKLGLPERDLVKISVARCARVSYVRQGERRDPVEDFKRHDDLSKSGHWSPFEHQAQAMPRAGAIRGIHGNLARGWYQYRKFFIDEAGGDDIRD